MDDRAEQNTDIKFHVLKNCTVREQTEFEQHTSETCLSFLNIKQNTLLPTSEMKAREKDTVLHLDVSPLTLLIIYYNVYMLCYYVTCRPWTISFPDLSFSYPYTKRYDGLSRLLMILDHGHMM